MPKKSHHDWEAVRTRYVTGREDIRTIAADDDTPSEGALFRRMKKEDWTGQRDAYRQRTASMTRERVAVETAEVAARQVRMAQAIQAKGLTALRKIDPDRLTPYQVARFIQLGATLERDALALDGNTRRDTVELGELTLDQLQRIAAGEDPERVAGG